MKKIILCVVGLILFIFIGIGIYYYSIIYTGFDINKTVYIYVDSDKDYSKILQEVRDSAKVKNFNNFEKLSDYMKYKENIKTGRYAVKPDMTIKQLITNLRSGRQTPVNLKFNNIRTKEDLAKRISNQLMITDEEIITRLNDAERCESLGFTTNNVVAMFIPNTYEVYWDISLENFITRMNKEYLKFWNNDRIHKVKEIGLTPVQVSTLASIVEEECTYSDEYPIVAGLYLNRIRRGQMLQADPTVKFAVGDFSLRRILNKHLEVESPYNTYRNTGLPPGPIRIPSIKGIDAVLNYQKNDYLFMCAKEDFSGRHNFAKTLAEHENNATKYRSALNANRIY